MVNKIENLTLQNKLRITFNYFCVKEDLLGTYIKLNSKVYNNLANFNYKCLFIVDLKYVYLIILLYSKDRYYFIFIISNIG